MFEPTDVAVPDQVPLELKVNPDGIEPDVTENVTVLPSLSVAVTAVKFDDALSSYASVPSEPAATLNTGIAFILKASASVFAKPEVFSTLTS